ncbi:lectin BRA-3 [Biomphalaria pfeifferi]|uniref:Lectin BRA-3 n=1 Tax=Biomphalaria pfeifferi TaxID=112525 RepID=A0AAD8BMR9_BIOPF|nr:lectin BRA-3 [Biomphalaria pfeifferi]
MIAIHSSLYYEDANKYCAKTYSGGHLVYILDKETDTFITRTFLTNGYWYYIGLSDKEKNGDYKWINGQKVSYTGWFGENHIPYAENDYVVVSWYGWYEVFDTTRKFICQSVAAKSLSFSLNHQDFVNSTREVTALTINTLRCEVDDNDDHHLQLLYQNSDGTVSKIEEKLGKSLTYTFWPGFNSSGVYVCQIRQQLEAKSVSLTGALKVIRNATYCDEQDPNHNVIVAGNTDVTFHKFCVFVYPRPTTLTVFTGATKHNPEFRYKANFTYIDETSARGEINIRFYNVTSSHYGRYHILFYHKYVSSKLYFNIAGPPKCPNNLTSEELDQNTVRLTWSPIAYEIFEQLFKIFKANRLGDFHVATVSDKKKMFLSYNVTGLSPNTKYSFYLHVKAGQFEIPCKHVITSVLIKGPAALPQDGDTNDMFYIIPIVAVVVLLVIFVVIIVVVRKIKLNQKNKNTFNDQKNYRYNCGSETISAQQSSPSDVNNSANTLAPVCSSEVAENIYNNVLESHAEALKPARKSGSSMKLKEKVSIATGKRQASTLPLGKTLVTWDDDINVYENTPEDTSKQDQEHTHDKVSSKESEISNRELQMQEAKPSEDSRTVSPEGLVYVSVEINRTSKTPKLVEEKPKASDKMGKSQDENKTEICQEGKSSYDTVEYSSLDYLATSQAAIENSSGSLAGTEVNE